MSKDQRRPNCPRCGQYTAARTRSRRINCEPFCTVRCAAAYGRGQFEEGDPHRIWDVQTRSWVSMEVVPEGGTCEYIYFPENGWERREPKRWHWLEDDR